MPRRVADGVFWINKTPLSTSLSHSEGSERVNLLSQAQLNSRAARNLARKAKEAGRGRQTYEASSTVFKEQEEETEWTKDDTVPLHPYLALQMSVPRAVVDSVFELQRSELIHALDTLRMEDSLYAFIPARIGTSRVVEHAAQAVVAARNCYILPNHQRSALVSRAAIASYVSAIRVLKSSLDGSDATLMACLLLQLSDSLSDDPNQRGMGPAHIDGVSAVLAVKAKQIALQPPSDFASMAFYSIRYLTCFLPITQGVASPFDNGLAARLRWTSPTRSPTSQEADLRQIAQELFVRVPRLIAGTRSLRNGNDANLDEALSLAADLCGLHNPDAETWFFQHKATYVRTVAACSEHVGDYSFSFYSLSQWECMVLYWESHLLLFRLCHELSRIAPTGHPTIQKFTHNVHQDRMAYCVLMSWQFVHQRYNTGLGVRIRSALIACYSIVGLKSTFQSRSSAALRQWINQILYRKGVGPDVGDVAEALAGGPVEPFRDWTLGSFSILGNRASNK